VARRVFFSQNSVPNAYAQLLLMIRQQIALVLCSIAVMCSAQDNGSVPTEQYFEAGQKALAAGRFEDAERNFEKLRDLEPRVAEIRANLGLVYFREGKYEQAVSELNRALKLKPDLPKIPSLLAMSLSELGRYKEALPELEKCFAESSELPSKRMCGLQLERSYTGLRRDGDAVQVALELQRLFPGDAEILYHNEKIYGNFAFQTIQQLVHAAPNSMWRHQAAAEAYESQGNYTLSLSEYKEVLNQDPHRPGIHYRIGRTLLAREDQTHLPADAVDAAKEFEQELQVDSSNANAAYELADIYRKSQQLDKAEDFFELALKHYPDFEDAHVGLAAVLITQNKPTLAIAHLKQAVALRPSDDVAWYRLAQAERLAGDTAGQKTAMAEFQRLRSIRLGAGQDQNASEVTRQAIEP
jgi:predicted Zn-dependent protease